MASFSRKTILAVTDILSGWSHSSLDRFLLEHGLEEAQLSGGSREARANGIARYLLGNPDATEEDGRNLVDAVVDEVVQSALSNCRGYSGFDYQIFQQRYSALARGLERDGFSVEDGRLRRALPASLDLPAADDEVHALLEAYAFAVAAGHLDQAITAHSRGDWAAANAQLRSFIESLLDEIAERLAGNVSGLPPAGHQRRQWLAGSNPPFLSVRSTSGLGMEGALSRRFTGDFTRKVLILGCRMKTTRRSDSISFYLSPGSF